MAASDRTQRSCMEKDDANSQQHSTNSTQQPSPLPDETDEEQSKGQDKKKKTEKKEKEDKKKEEKEKKKEEKEKKREEEKKKKQEVKAVKEAQQLVDWVPRVIEDQTPRLKKGYVLGGVYKVIGVLGFGTFGQILLVKHVESKVKRAVKVGCKTRHKDTARMIHECQMLTTARELNLPHFPQTFGSGVVDDKGPQYDFIVMELLSESLTDLRGGGEKPMTIGSALRCGYQAIEALMLLHTKIGYIHRDIKPANMVFGGNHSNKRVLYLIDFGLVRRIKLAGEGQGEKKREGKVGFRGTARYASLRTLKHEDQYYGDDLYGAMFTMYEQLNGSLPWKNAKLGMDLDTKRDWLHDHERYEQKVLGRLKDESRKEVAGAEKMIRRSPTKMPDYDAILAKLAKAITIEGIGMDEPYDWEATNK